MSDTITRIIDALHQADNASRCDLNQDAQCIIRKMRDIRSADPSVMRTEALRLAKREWLQGVLFVGVSGAVTD